jgi:hypothetical protein
MPVLRYLDLSTAHLTQREAEEVCGGPSGQYVMGDLDHSPRLIQHEYGAWVHVPAIDETTDEQDHAALAATRPNLAACIVRARELGCTWINFDQDADTEPGLPTFDW